MSAGTIRAGISAATRPARARGIGIVALASIASCTTIRAARDLASSNPVCGIRVEAPAASPGGMRIIEWSADYRDPPPFEGWVWIPGNTVTRRGSFPLPPGVDTGDIYVERDGEPTVKLGGEPVELQPCVPFRLYGGETARRQAFEAGDSSDTDAILRVRDAAEDAHQTAIVVEDCCGDEITVTELPVEIPYHSPERWAWLVAAPVVDAVVLPVNVLLVGMIIVVASVP